MITASPDRAVKEQAVPDGASLARTVPDRQAVAAPRAIDVRGLSKRYGALDAVRGITFNVNHGEMFGLIGPDGAGKTSTFQILAGVMEATTGNCEHTEPPGTRYAIPNRISDAGLQSLSRSDRSGKHSL